MIYFVESPDGLRVKIGTTIRLSQRLKQLRAKHGAVNVIAVTEGSFAEESILHARFAAHRIEGEWFVFAPMIHDFIRDHADAWDGTDEAPPDASAKMDAEVVAEAKMVASSKDISLAQYLSELVRPLVKRDLDIEYGRRRDQPSIAKKKGAKHE